MAYESGWPDVLPRPVHRRMEQVEPKNAWFRIYKVASGVYSIVEPFHYEEPISFLVEGSQRAMLLDTGMGLYDIKREAEALTRKGLFVVNSHWHYDHIGGNYQFDDIWAFDNDFEVSKIEAGMPASEVSYSMTPEWLAAPLPEGMDASQYMIRPCKVTRRLSHLEEIDLGNRILVVHHTPGHSPGGLCLLDKSTGILFTGDTYYPGALFANLERSEFDVFLKSLIYLDSILGDVNFVCPSHNESKVDKAEISSALSGFLKVKKGEAGCTVTEHARVYKFGRFSVELPR